ncbi:MULTISPECIES: sugar phosphate isomerase/epimerase family protein [Crateriforma]|uniref:D-tagatose 3-epimerase n=1 Tax=Crateriforma conspicua TaxID=2527996 RepID=A0A5C6FTM0_9PLAN|nr:MULTISPECIES: sugar phosphate isomerase/epimerase family protein [Crateriforma]TWU64830.1 D-tagatose 3-epimerase [Crateriforma conspicua]
MNTLAINQLSTLRWDMQDDALAYANRGFSGIGIYRPKLEDFGLDRTVELLAESSLSATSLSWAGGFTGSDGRRFDEAVDDAMVAIREAANLRAGTLIVLAGGRNNHIRNHVRRTLLEALRRVSCVAEEFGVTLSLEPIHPGCGYEWSFINDLESCLEIIDAVGSPNLGVTLDTYHVGMDDDIVRWLPDVIPHLRLLQLGDGHHCPLGEMNRCLLGEGNVPIATLLQTLRMHNYRGPIEVEVIGEDVETLQYDCILDHAKGFLDRVLPDATRATLS